MTRPWKDTDDALASLAFCLAIAALYGLWQLLKLVFAWITPR
jgi:hypothetical protein